MNLKKAAVLITGGTEGVGKGLAERFLASGAKVMVTGRSDDKLQQLQTALPGVLVFKSDAGSQGEREHLARHVREVLPDLNILINNAGIQRRVGLAEDTAAWSERQAEIDILFAGPVHLNHLLIPLLLANHKESLIVNVTSGGAYIPQAFAPVYSASKAALHHYTVTLRHALSATRCRVSELIPPAVQTALAGPGLNHGVPINEFCDHVFSELFLKDRQTVGFGQTAGIAMTINGQFQDDLFQNSSKRFPVVLY